LKSRDFVRLASVGLVIAALVPADAASIGSLKPTPETSRHTIMVSEPALASPPLTTAVERVAPQATATLRPHNPAADSQRFIELINEARRAHGLAPLRSRKDLRTIAIRWSARMAAMEKIWHNRKLRNQVFGWWRLGENVGWAAGSVEYLHQAFLASPEHRRNILDPLFTSIGVAETVSADGRIFVVEDFGRFSPL
jgi:uncharacterized protein YkwD